MPAVRVLLGAILLVNSAMDWNPAAYHTYSGIIYSNASVSPPPLQPPLIFAAQLVGGHPGLFGGLVAGSETLLGLALVLGLWTRLALLISVPFFLLIRKIGQGFGLPFNPGTTDLNSGILYCLVAAILLVQGPDTLRHSLDGLVAGDPRRLRRAQLATAAAVAGAGIGVVLLAR